MSGRYGIQGASRTSRRARRLGRSQSPGFRQRRTRLMDGANGDPSTTVSSETPPTSTNSPKSRFHTSQFQSSRRSRGDDRASGRPRAARRARLSTLSRGPRLSTAFSRLRASRATDICDEEALSQSEHGKPGKSRLSYHKVDSTQSQSSTTSSSDLSTPDHSDNENPLSTAISQRLYDIVHKS